MKIEPPEDFRLVAAEVLYKNEKKQIIAAWKAEIDKHPDNKKARGRAYEVRNKALLDARIRYNERRWKITWGRIGRR